MQKHLDQMELAIRVAPRPATHHEKMILMAAHYGVAKALEEREAEMMSN